VRKGALFIGLVLLILISSGCISQSEAQKTKSGYNFTVKDSMYEIAVICVGGGAEGQFIGRDAYYEYKKGSVFERMRIKSTAVEGGGDYQETELYRFKVEPSGLFTVTWIKLDSNGEYNRTEKYTAEWVKYFESNMFNGDEANPDELDEIFTDDFATSEGLETKSFEDLDALILELCA
jgi:hypothetical protein